MAKSGPKIEYHPEFLYFNDFVRRHNYHPTKHQWVWQEPYARFNWILEHVQLRKGQKQVTNLIQEFVQKGILPKLDTKLDCTPWLEFAYSIDFEKMVDVYSSVIFEYFGTSFNLPRFKISCVRLRPCNPKLYSSLLAGGYSLETILRSDPACFCPDIPMIYMPLPEGPRKLPLGLYDELVIHEMMHVPTKSLGIFNIVVGDLWMIQRPPSFWAFEHFGELLANIGSIKVLMKAGTFRKKDFKKIANEIVYHRAISFSEVSAAATAAMMEVPFEKWCDILSPVFSIEREMDFLLTERKRIQSASEKKLEGILRKKYEYTESIKGKSEKQIRDEVAKRSASRIGAVFGRLKEMDMRNFLQAALAKERNARQKKAFETLLQLFSEENRPLWPPLC